MQHNRIIVYFRTRPAGRKAYGYDLNRQKALLADFIGRKQVMVAGEYIEVEDGSGNRPELGKALEHARSDGALLVIAKLWRSDRTPDFIRLLIDGDVDFIALDRMDFHRWSALDFLSRAEAEVRTRSERAKSGMAAAKRHGAKFGAADPRCRRTGDQSSWRAASAASVQVRREKAERQYAAILPRIKEMREQGDSFEKIARVLNDEGYMTTTGSPLRANFLARLIVRDEGRLRRKRRSLDPQVRRQIGKLREDGKTYREIADWMNTQGIKNGYGDDWNVASVVAIFRKRGPATASA